MKIVLTGNSGVGKTCILDRFANNEFTNTVVVTYGVDFRSRDILFNGSDIIRVQVWDTSGGNRYRNITYSYFKGAQAIIIVYDVCDRKSFEDTSIWANAVRKKTQDTVLLLI